MQTRVTPTSLWTHVLNSGFKLASCLGPDDPDQLRLSSPESEMAYAFRYSIAALCRPARYLEIGAGRGHGALAALSACPQASVVLVDQDEEALRHAAGMLGGRFPDSDMSFLVGRRSGGVAGWVEPALALGRYHLVVVDGDATRPGCQDALQAAYWLIEPGGFLLIDGYDESPGVRKAADDFLFSLGPPHIYCASGRGLILCNIRRK